MTFTQLGPSLLARLGVLLLASCSVMGCGGGDPPRFERLPVSTTGIDFNNTIVEDNALLNPIDFFEEEGGAIADVFWYSR